MGKTNNYINDFSKSIVLFKANNKFGIKRKVNGKIIDKMYDNSINFNEDLETVKLYLKILETYRNFLGKNNYHIYFSVS